MTTLLVVFGVMLVIVAAMAVGVIFGRKPITGSCGGMSAIGMDVACAVCGGDKDKCRQESEEAAAVAQETKASFYDATKR